jgi:hypothetical protein
MWHSGAIATFLGQPVRESRLLTGHVRRLRTAEVDELIVDYRSGRFSTYDIADKFGINRQTVSKLLKARGLIVGQQSLSDSEKVRIDTLRAEGFSANAIGLAIGRDPKTVRKSLAQSANGADLPASRRLSSQDDLRLPRPPGQGSAHQF